MKTYFSFSPSLGGWLRLVGPVVVALLTSVDSLRADVPAPLIRQFQPSLADGSVLLRWDATPDSAYRVLTSTNLNDGWTPVDYLVASSNSVTWQANGQSGVTRFYKLATDGIAILNVEPSVISTGTVTTVYLTGQGFGPDDVLTLIGPGGPWVLTNRVVISPTLISFTAGPTFTPDVPGTYQLQVTSGSTGQTASSKTASLTVSGTPGGSVQALLEPPQEPPASPQANFFSKKGYDFYQAQSVLAAVGVHPSGLVEEIRENDNVVFEVSEGKKGLNAVNVTLARKGAGPRIIVENQGPTLANNDRVAGGGDCEMFAFDGYSRMVMASNNLSCLSSVYDSLGNRIKATQDCIAATERTFDGVGNCLSMIYPSGRVVTYTYDALDQVSSVASRASFGLPPTTLASYSYDGVRLSRIARNNGINTDITWNGMVSPPNARGDFGAQQVARINHAAAGGSPVIDQRRLAYDRNQNKTLRGQTTEFAPGQGFYTNNWSYNPLNMLVSSAYGIICGTSCNLDNYNLDAVGNRVATLHNGLEGSYTRASTIPPGDFQVNQYTTTPFDSRIYDNNGNLIQVTSSAGPTALYLRLR